VKVVFDNVVSKGTHLFDTDGGVAGEFDPDGAKGVGEGFAG